jgi:2'-5' RNA ligase
MRLFVALDIDEAIRGRLGRFVEGVREFASDARWVKAESLHVTLKFIGEWPEESLKQMEQTLGDISSETLELEFGGYGFFPTEKAARVFWVGIVAGPALAQLAGQVDEALGPLGIAKEQRPFSPHLTLARAAGGSGAPGWRKDDRTNAGFRRVQEKLAAMAALEFGRMTAREFFLYRSQLSPKGSRYSKVARFPLTSDGDAKRS